MSRKWIDKGKLAQDLSVFFDDKRKDIELFGRTVNQCFETFVFASLIGFYRDNGWTVSIHHPPGEGGAKLLTIKGSTQGRPDNYSYAECAKGGDVVEVRHQLRVATASHQTGQVPPANVVLDVAVIKRLDLSSLGTNDFVDNAHLVTFGEAKHMPAFAELVAGFIGLVHELQPGRLSNVRGVNGPATGATHVAPFMYVSQYLQPTAQGIQVTLNVRGFDIDVYTPDSSGPLSLKLPQKDAPPKVGKKNISDAAMVHISDVRNILDTSGETLRVREVADRLGIESKLVSECMQRLLYDGVVEKQGERAGTRYHSVQGGST